MKRLQRRAVSRLTEEARAMMKHGKGSKYVYVRKYRQWQDGELRRVDDHPRGNTPKLSIRRDLLPNLPSFIRRVCSSFAPAEGVLRTRLV